MENIMRTKLMTMVAALSFCMALAVSVQAKSGKHSAASGRTSVIGCLQTGSSPNTYVLNNVSESTKSSKSMSKSSQAPSEMARSEGSYMLIPEGNVNLQNWVGKRVRVTGRMATSTSSNPNESSSSGSSSSSSESSSSTSGSEFMVTSIRAASGTCQ